MKRPDVVIGTYGGLGDASSDFAARAKQLSDLARRAYAASQQGDAATAARLMAEYRTLNGQLAPQQQAAVKAALEKEMPSAFLLRLSAWGDMFGALLSKPLLTLALIGGAVYLATRGGRSQYRSEW